MKRGELWTASGAGYAGKPRPAVIVSDDGFEDMESVTLLPCSSVDPEQSTIRIALTPSPTNGLESPTWIATDKVTTLHRSKLGKRIGAVSVSELEKISEALIVYLGLGR